MKSTSIKSSLVKGLMLIVLFFLIQAGLVWYAVSDAKNTVVENTRKNTVATSELGKLAILAQQIRRFEKEYFVYVGNKGKRDSYEKEWRGALGKIDSLVAKIKSGSDGAFSDKDIRQTAGWSAASAFYASEMNKIFLAVNERAASVQAEKEAAAAAAVTAKPGTARPVGKTGPITVTVKPVEKVALADFTSIEANGMIAAGKDKFAADFIKSVAEMEKAKTTDTLELANVAKKLFNQVLLGVLVTVAIGIIVALLLSIRLPAAVAKTIAGLSAAANEMSMGNLDKTYDSGGVTEFNELAEALDRMRLGQRALVERLQKRQK